MVHTFINVCKRNLCKLIDLWHEKTKQQALETRQHILDVALRLFSQQGVSSTSLAAIAKAAGVTRGAIYWHFKNKSDLFNEIWVLSDASISDLEVEYRAKFPNDPLSVVRGILVHVLEATVTEERRRLMMEIIFHKCEFVGEMAVVQKAQRSLCLESYERIEHTLKECIAANMLPANLLTRRAAVLMRSYLSGLMENWLFAPDSFDLEKEARDYVAILLEMYQFCPTLRAPSEAKN
ncbi:Potential acrAB operon repressor [Raoultella ornithinolytica]|nr:Potential acrAB operon repressor [Raoultella ornithinolytica]